jgi:hypothetical protein
LKVLLAGFLVLSLFGAPAWAEAFEASRPPSLALSNALPATTRPIVTDIALTQPYKTWTVQITPTIPLVGGKFSPNWQRRSAHGDYRSLEVPVDIFYGITPRMDFSAEVNFIQNWASSVGPANRAASFGSLGDSSLTWRYMFFFGKSTDPIVTTYCSVLFPTGHAADLEPKLLGTDQTGIGAFAFTWGIDYLIYLPKVPALFYVNAWYTNFAGGWVNGARVYYPDQVTVNLALEVPLKRSLQNRWAFLLEVLSTWDAGRLFGPKANQAPAALVTVLPALEYLPTSWFNMALGVQVDLIGKNTQFAYAPTLALFFNF